jgi:hypothetical protein
MFYYIAEFYAFKKDKVSVVFNSAMLLNTNK